MQSGAHVDISSRPLLDGRARLSAADLSLVSWLEVLNNAQFTTPFVQRELVFNVVPLMLVFLDVDVVTSEYYRRPRLDARWSEQIMAAPMRSDRFPHALVPSGKSRLVEKMSRSMIMPTLARLGFVKLQDTRK